MGDGRWSSLHAAPPSAEDRRSAIAYRLRSVTLSPAATGRLLKTYNDMSAKRALIVDDSRSARVILSRMLEGYGLEIDATESAEQALEYLKESKPDVIFMDHLMPGMDGFQAIQAIKGNPLTAMIPVMMYTSQEGELYLSQARALGAVGVLPKTVKQGELSRILYQLRLLPERRDPKLIVQPRAQESRRDEVVADEIPTIQIDAPPKLTIGEIEGAIRSAIGPALQEQNVEIRRFVAGSLEAFARRINSDARPPASSPADATVVIEDSPPPAPERSPRWPLAAAVAAIALLPTIVLAVLYTRTLQSTTEMMQSNTRLASVVEEQQAQLATLQASLKAVAASEDSSADVSAAAIVETEAVPYGEAPLSGARLERLREMVNRLRAQGFGGRLRVASYVGEFCLTGNGIEGYSLAADDLPVKRCDLVGNPFDDSLSVPQRQSVGFANLMSTIKQQTGDELAIEVAYAGRKPSVPYPEGERLNRATAGEWNRIAAQNNRVEFAAVPASE
jgi:CheY-like chemotaxis protein